MPPSTTDHGQNGVRVTTHRSSLAPDLLPHQPPPRADGRLPVTITHLELAPADWTRRGLAPAIDLTLTREIVPDVALYREVYDRVGRPWLWYDRRLLSDDALRALLAAPGHELHVARDGAELVGYFEI